MNHINLRSTLVTGVDDFCRTTVIAETIEVQNKALVELIFLIARYEEEGVKLHPKLYITSDICTALKMLPGQSSMMIGASTCFYDAVKSALKKCAPLALNGWCIYVSRTEGSAIEFGVFRGDTNPTAVDIDSIILTDDLPFQTIKIHQIAKDNVEVKSSVGSALNISLNHTIDNTNTPIVQLKLLVDNLVGDVQTSKEQVTNYLSRLLNESIKKSHGCLIAVLKNSDMPGTLLTDGTCLVNPIDFHSLVNESLGRDKNAGNLISMGQLLEGMLNSDGIVVFDKRARLLAFNCFTALPERADSMNAIGGARTRAYNALCELLNTELEAVYMQSQDGWTQFQGANNE